MFGPERSDRTVRAQKIVHPKNGVRPKHPKNGVSKNGSFWGTSWTAPGKRGLLPGPYPAYLFHPPHPARTHVLTRPAESLPGCIQRDTQKRSRAKEAFGEKSASALPTNRRPPDQTCSEPPKNMVFHQNPHLKTNDILDTNRMWFFDVANTRLLIISCHEVIMRCVR